MRKFTPPNVLFVAIVSVLLSVSGCKKENTPQTISDTQVSQVSNNQAAPSYYLSGMLGTEAISLPGNPVAYNDSTDAIHPHGGCDNEAEEDHDGDFDDAANYTGSRWVTTDPNTNALVSHGSVDVRKLIVRIYAAPLVATNYYNMIALSSYGFVNHNIGSGVYVTVRDSQGILWTTNGDQTGSTFTITSRTALSSAVANFSGTFTAKMYDGHGNVKQLTNGVFSATAKL